MMRDLWWMALVLAFVAQAARSETLDLKGYLDQVKKQNPSVQGSTLASEGAKERSEEADLLYTPQAFVNLTGLYDGKPVLQPAFQPNLTRATRLEFGVMKQWDFGLNARVYHSVTATRLFGVSSGILPQPNYIDTSPNLELSQSLWRNGFGAETRAQADLLTASALANQYVESFKVKAQVSGAEAAYWRLALARELVDIQKDSLTRAVRLKEWAARRTRLDLADKADFLQADANYRLKEIELKGVIEEARQAARAFNLGRGADSDEVKESLVRLDEEGLKNLTAPARAAMRDDVKAAQQQERAAAAQAEGGKQKNSPTLDVQVALSLNGRDPALGDSLSEAYSTKHPYGMIGIKFATPLDFGLVKRNRAGYEKERQGAELNFKRKVLEQDSEWKSLQEKFEERQARLTLMRQMEEAQKLKVEHEQERLRRAKTTTYQVLLFEDDYSNARKARLQLAGELLGITAQMKTFGGEPVAPAKTLGDGR